MKRVLVGTLILFIVAFATSTHVLSQSSYDPATMDPPERGSDRSLLEEFHVGAADQRINGFVYLASGDGPHPTVVLLHGLPGNERNLDLAQAMRRAGANVV